jgi:hypothetical protein
LEQDAKIPLVGAAFEDDFIEKKAWWMDMQRTASVKEVLLDYIVHRILA